MKRYILFLLLLALVVGTHELPRLIAQTAPPHLAPPQVPGAGDPAPRLPVPPPQVFAPGPLPGIGMPPGFGMLPGTGSPPPRSAQPPDPRMIELTNRYNQLEQEVMQLAQQFRQTAAEEGEEQRARLQQRIVEITEQQFQIKHEVRQMEVDRLQQQLTQLQEQLQRREERKKEIVSRRVAELTVQDDPLRWEPLTVPGTSPASSGYDAPGNWVFPGGPGTTYPPGSGAGPAAPPTVPTAVPNLPYPPIIGKPAAPRADDARAPSMPTMRDPATAAVPSVTEAEARLAIAERDLARVKTLFESGTIPADQFAHAQDAVQLARLQLEEARQDHALKVKMLELDMREAEAACEAARAELDAVRQRSAGELETAEGAAQLWRAEAVVLEKHTELERKRLVLARQLQRAQPAADAPELPVP